MRRIITYSLIALGALILIALILTWIYDPNWRDDPASILKTLAIAAAAVVALASGIVRIWRDLKEIAVDKARRHQPPPRAIQGLSPSPAVRTSSLRICRLKNSPRPSASSSI